MTSVVSSRRPDSNKDSETCEESLVPHLSLGIYCQSESCVSELESFQEHRPTDFTLTHKEGKIQILQGLLPSDVSSSVFQ